MDIVTSPEMFRAYIRLILIQIWDPIGVKRFGIISHALVADTDDDLLMIPLEPMQHKEIVFNDMENEYDAYIPVIEAMILNQEPAQVIYDYMRDVETLSMEREGDKAVTWNAANRLHLIGMRCRIHEQSTGNSH